MGLEFPGESAEYRAARNELLARERDLRRMLEEVAAAPARIATGRRSARGLRVPRDA